MKILFLSATVGAGHNVIAQNISNELNKMGNETKIVKLFDKAPFFNWILTKIFFKLNALTPKIFSKAYQQQKNQKANSLRESDVAFRKKTRSQRN